MLHTRFFIDLAIKYKFNIRVSLIGILQLIESFFGHEGEKELRNEKFSHDFSISNMQVKRRSVCWLNEKANKVLCGTLCKY